MTTLKAIIEDPDGGIIARFYETPSKDHDFEVSIVTEDDRIHQVSVRTPVTSKKIENEVENLFDSLGGLYENVDWTIDMK